MITRHFVDLGARRVHYRRAGNGPAILMAHQSPRSSAEYEPLMARWSERFTCIAPDTPGFGQSDPLPEAAPDIQAFGEATLAFADAIGLERFAAYGFHSGGIVLAAALRQAPERFAALAIGGYAIWTPEEMRIFGESYLPPFQPSAYGEHLTWLWNRVLEQSWVFPWFDVRPEARLSASHDDPAKVDAVVREMLDSGDAYRAGYGAVLRAPRDVPPADSCSPPVLITAYDGDPLQAHLARLGAMPAAWSARPVATPAEHQDASFAFLAEHALPAPPSADSSDEGFIRVTVAGFDGLIHWRGTRGAELTLHAPGEGLDLGTADLGIDLPGHGLSDAWPDAPSLWSPWRSVIDTAAAALGASTIALPPAPVGDVARLFPDLTPDRFGAYLTTAWQIVRAATLFAPWYEANATHAIAFAPADLAPERLALRHRALIRAGAARAYAAALQARETPR